MLFGSDGGFDWTDSISVSAVRICRSGKVPWHRDTRSGIYVYGIRDLGSKELAAKSTLADVTPPPGVAPSEFKLSSTYQTFAGQSKANSHLYLKLAAAGQRVLGV
jgi:hypothetical protein